MQPWPWSPLPTTLCCARRPWGWLSRCTGSNRRPTWPAAGKPITALHENTLDISLAMRPPKVLIRMNVFLTVSLSLCPRSGSVSTAWSSCPSRAACRRWRPGCWRRCGTTTRRPCPSSQPQWVRTNHTAFPWHPPPAPSNRPAPRYIINPLSSTPWPPAVLEASFLSMGFQQHFN